MHKKVISIITVIIGVIFISGCSSNVKVGYIGSNTNNKMTGAFKYFNGTESNKEKFNAGDEVTITYSFELEEGELKLVVEDKDGNEVVSESDNSGEVTFEVSKTERYVISVIGTKAKGNFDIAWNK